MSDTEPDGGPRVGHTKASALKSRLNRQFDGTAKIVSGLDHIPKVSLVDAIDSSRPSSAAPADTQFLVTERLIGEAGWTIRVRPTTFRQAQSRRLRSERPPVLSVSAVVVYGSALVLHRRSGTSATYPDRWHTLGGAVEPRDLEQTGLRSALEREVREEMAVPAVLGPIPVGAWCEELSTGYQQYVALGVTVDQPPGEPTSEGTAVLLPFEELATLLSQSAIWVPSGRLHILLWLSSLAESKSHLNTWAGVVLARLSEPSCMTRDG